MQRTGMPLVVLLLGILAVIGKSTNKFKDKDGLCPEIQTPESCLFDKEYQCWFDNNCNGTKKCCSSGCSLECVDPITSNITDCMGPADVAFLLDVSGSIEQTGYSGLIAFLKKAISLFEIGAASTHVAVISFANDAHVAFDFNTLKGDNLTKSAVLELVDGIKETTGLKRIDKALRLAATDVFSTKRGMRPYQTQLLILLSDGINPNGPGIDDLQVASRPLKERGVHVYSAAIGSNYDIDQLLDAASDDCSVFRVGKMNDVLSLIKGVAKQSCKGNRIAPNPLEAGGC